MLSVLYAIACQSVPLSHGWNSQQESHAVAGKLQDATVNSDLHPVCWHCAGAISAISAGVLRQCTTV